MGKQLKGYLKSEGGQGRKFLLDCWFGVLLGGRSRQGVVGTADVDQTA